MMGQAAWRERVLQRMGWIVVVLPWHKLHAAGADGDTWVVEAIRRA